MAKRKSSDGEGLNLDSLMDTVTNVVGVLMIVLIMVSLNIAVSVSKILSDLPPVEVSELERLKKEVTENVPQEDPIKVADESKSKESEIKKVTEELETLDINFSKQKVKMMDLDDLTKQIEERKKIRDAKKADVEKLLTEVDRLKALLDTTPVYAPPPATVVKLPNPRPMPEKAVLRRFLVANGRVLYLNDEEFMKMVIAEIEKNQKLLINSEVPVKDKDGNVVMVTERGKQVPKTKTLLDQKKIAAHFEKLRIATREIKLDLVVSPNSYRIPMKLTPLPDAGEAVEEIKNPASVFQRAMRKFKTEPDSVIWFLVFKDSLDTYLAARDIADLTGVPAGWEIYGNNFFQRSVMPFEVDYTPPPPAPPGTVRIAAPKTTLD
ncbi:hypothetical protein BH11VER1_BH11VER1_13400 [soil metagenome]